MTICYQTPYSTFLDAGSLVTVFGQFITNGTYPGILDLIPLITMTYNINASAIQFNLMVVATATDTLAAVAHWVALPASLNLIIQPGTVATATPCIPLDNSPSAAASIVLPAFYGALALAIIIIVVLFVLLVRARRRKRGLKKLVAGQVSTFVETSDGESISTGASVVRGKGGSAASRAAFQNFLESGNATASEYSQGDGLDVNDTTMYTMGASKEMVYLDQGELLLESHNSSTPGWLTNTASLTTGSEKGVYSMGAANEDAINYSMGSANDEEVHYSLGTVDDINVNPFLKKQSAEINPFNAKGSQKPDINREKKVTGKKKGDSSLSLYDNGNNNEDDGSRQYAYGASGKTDHYSFSNQSKEEGIYSFGNIDETNYTASSDADDEGPKYVLGASHDAEGNYLKSEPMYTSGNSLLKTNELQQRKNENPYGMLDIDIDDLDIDDLDAPVPKAKGYIEIDTHEFLGFSNHTQALFEGFGER